MTDVRTWGEVGGAVEGATVLMFEDSSSNVTAYDMEILPHIRSDSSYIVSIPYQSTSCGIQEQVLVAHAGQKNWVEASTTVSVSCPPLYLPIIRQDAISR